jgi:protoheme IX farnesyltransferase
VKDLLELSKPRITLLVAACAAAGFLLAPGARDLPRLLWTLAGVALASASTGCLNQVLEAEHDAAMTRTAGRPVPSGRVGAARAHAAGLLWGAAGLLLLAWKSTPPACALTAFTLASYLLVYTPMKRYSPWSTWVGAVPGALPPVIGWAAAGGALDGRAAALFAVQFFWQLPHFLALAWLHRDDYARGGFRVLPVVEPDGRSTARQLLASTALLCAASAAPYALGLGGLVYLTGAAALGLPFLLLAAQGARRLDERSARRLFLASLAYLPVVLALLVADRR